MYTIILGKSPSVGEKYSPNVHLSLITASAGQTAMPTNRSIAAINVKNTENVFLKRRRGSLYNATNVTSLKTDIRNESREKDIPLPRQIDFSKSRSVTISV